MIILKKRERSVLKDKDHMAEEGDNPETMTKIGNHHTVGKDVAEGGMVEVKEEGVRDEKRNNKIIRDREAEQGKRVDL